MKTIIKSGAILALLLALGGCVYGPGYGYVRGDGYYGDAYYGDVYSGPAYYGSGYYYGPGYYGYGYAPSIGIYYSDYGHGYRHGGRGGYWHGNGWGGNGYGRGWSGSGSRPTPVVPHGNRGTPPSVSHGSRGAPSSHRR